MIHPQGSDDTRRDEYSQKHRYQPPDGDEEDLSLLRLHVRHIVAGQEERHVRGDEHRQDSPPLVYPDERVVARGGQEAFHQREQQGHRRGQPAQEWCVFLFHVVFLSSIFI